MLRADRHEIRAWGIFGGREGKPGSCVLNPGTEKEEILPPRITDRMVRAGEIIRVTTPGGGGWGDPLDRDVNRVLDDVLNGYVSIQSARDDYGVLINEKSLEINSKATKQLRQRKP
jgi:N-methylhydantoinase B/oxoprolinase/acetone carboxylase alpha subunit